MGWHSYARLNLILAIAVALAAVNHVEAQCRDYKDECEAVGPGTCYGLPLSYRSWGDNWVFEGGWDSGGPCGWRFCGEIVCSCGKPLADDLCEYGPQSRGTEARSIKLDDIVLPLDRQERLYGLPRVQRPLSERPISPTAQGVRGLTPAEKSQLRTIVRQWRGLDTLSGAGTFTVRLGHGERVIAGTFDAKMQGDLYNYSVRLPEGSILGQGFAAAFDGFSHQLLVRGQNLLSLQTRDWRDIPRTFPNPLLLPTWAFVGDSLRCTTCDLSLERLNAVEEDWLCETARVEGRSKGATMILLPGVVGSGPGDFFRLELDSLKQRVNWVRHYSQADNAPVELALEYDASPGKVPTWMPTSILMTFIGDREIPVKVNFELSQAEAGAPIAPSAFEIDSHEARIVVDADAARLLKHPNLVGGR